MILFLFLALFTTVVHSLDQRDVNKLYFEGEFEKLNKILETELKDNPKLSRSDSIYIFSMLGVTYGSFPEDRIKGEGYLYSLFQLSPRFNFSSLLLSEELELWSEGVRERYKRDKAKNSNFNLPSDVYVWGGMGLAILGLAFLIFN